MPRNVLRAFSGRNLKWHVLAIAATFAIVTSGIDWRYFEATRPVARYFWYAVRLGFYMPIIFPIVSFIAGAALKSRRAIVTAYGTAQAAIMGLLISSFYKALTGRPGPRHLTGSLVAASREFRLGILRGGVFWGWPSSHTTVAFAMAIAIWKLFDSKVVRLIALCYAFYIGVGVSLTIHWFSDFVAGAIIGAVIGRTAGDTFRHV
ncbi:MAG: phosphatase PAP2 family protein [Nitrospiraceae bacterium]|nr:phosphatase PAP2 family protein [Nitrospiraceae bacterium]